MSFATNLEEYHHERKRPEHCQLHHLLRMLQRNLLDAAFTPEGAEYVEHFCGLDCYERFGHAPRPRQNLTLRLSAAVRSRQIEA